MVKKPSQKDLLKREIEKKEAPKVEAPKKEEKKQVSVEQAVQMLKLEYGDLTLKLESIQATGQQIVNRRNEIVKKLQEIEQKVRETKK